MSTASATSSQTTIISSHVIDTVRALPVKEREAIARALADEILLGNDPIDSLPPFQAALYSIITFYIQRDTARHFPADPLLRAQI